MHPSNGRMKKSVWSALQKPHNNAPYITTFHHWTTACSQLDYHQSTTNNWILPTNLHTFLEIRFTHFPHMDNEIQEIWKTLVTKAPTFNHYRSIKVNKNLVCFLDLSSLNMALHQSQVQWAIHNCSCLNSKILNYHTCSKLTNQLLPKLAIEAKFSHPI